jgi:hypothetical protein
VRPASRERDELCFELHFAADLAESGVLDLLQTALVTTVPGFREAVRVLGYERDRSAISVDVQTAGALRTAIVAKGTERGTTYKALAAGSPPAHARRFGHAMVRATPRAAYLSIDFDEYVPCQPMGDKWLFSNNVGGTFGPQRVAGVAREDWVQALVKGLGDDPRLLWGAAFLRSEFASRNLHNEADGMRALGRDVRKSLPGVFWLNVFGSAYVDLIGAQRLRNAPAASTSVLGSNVLVVAYAKPEDWSADLRMSHQRQLVDYLGQGYFYDRSHPDRPTIAPDFGLAILPPRRPVRAVTTDGRHFTPRP